MEAQEEDEERFSQERIEAPVTLSQEQLALEEWRSVGLVCPMDPIVYDVLHFQAADVRIDVDEDDENSIIIRIEPPDEILHATSITSEERPYLRVHLHKFRHDFVAAAFSEASTSTDVTMYSVFGRFDDELDHKTPDILYKEDEIYRCAEIATTRYDAGALTQFRNKLSTYDLILRDRAEQLRTTVYYTVVIVSNERIYTNTPLSDQCIRELSARYIIGEHVMDLARARNLLVDFSDAESKREMSCGVIKDQLSRIEIKNCVVSDTAMDPSYVDLVMGEVDKKVVLKSFETSLLKAADESDLTTTEVDLISRWSTSHHVRDMRRVCRVPYLIPRVSEPSPDVEFKHFSKWSNHPEISNCWNAAMESMSRDRIWDQEDADALLREALSDKDEASEKFKYHRVNVRGGLNATDITALTLDGLWAKSHGDKFLINEKRERKRRGLHWDTNTEDIENWLKEYWLFERGEPKGLMENYYDLVKVAIDSVGRPSHVRQPIQDVKELMSTNLFIWLNFISELSLELAISNKQNCKPGDMILKKLRNYEAYVLILPTKSTEHMFFSLCLFDPLIPKTTYLRMFMEWEDCGDGILTTFNSVKPSKIDNMAHMTSALLSISAFWCHQSEMSSASVENIKSKPAIMQLILLNLLVMLEDKSQTEEAITINRYAYMEVFKEKGRGWMDPNPLKTFLKANDKPRSRLELHVLKKSIMAFAVMVQNPPEREKITRANMDEELPPSDSWSGLINCLTHHPVRTATECINLVYMGYFKNKDESAEGNTDFSILKKTVEEEIKLREVNMECVKGLKEPNYPQPKEFSRNMIMYGTELLCKKLLHSLGPNYQERIGHDVLDALSRQMTTFISTLKASASLDPHSPPRDSDLSNDVKAGRRKVIEAIASDLKRMGMNPLHNLKYFLESLEKGANGVLADLFKKNQHAGLREIYVLDIYSRVIQLFVETCSRVICSKFESETLTHHQNKIKLLEEHKIKANKLARKEERDHVDYCNSCDKTRWNQNLSISALVIPLLRILPRLFHGAIFRCLNLWTNKQIRIPQRVINMMIQMIPLESPVYRIMLGEFWEGSGLFRNQREPFVHISTGMMQGILHYTSSLLHLTFLTAGQQMTLSHLREQFPQCIFTMSHVCSSDDSATIISCLGPKTNARICTIDGIRPYVYTSYMCHVLEHFSKFFCMTPSIKSTIGMRDYIEYNSEFILWNTMAMPIIKFTSACFRIQETLTIMERLNTMYNSLTDLVSNGMPYYYASICQFSQALSHYKAMGLSTNPLFSEYTDLLCEYPDPELGFFPLDHQFCPGVLGLKFSIWKTGTNHLTLKEPSKLLNVEDKVTCSMIETLEKRVGDLKRWESLMSRVSSGIDWRTHVEGNPDLLYRHPESLEECRIKLCVKASQPGVSKSLTTGASYVKGLNSTVYSINKHCYTKREVFMSSVSRKKERTKEKVSILQILYKLSELPRSHISNNSLRMLFPFLDIYERADSLLTAYSELPLVRCARARQTKNLMVMQSALNPIPFKMLDVVRAKWFNHDLPASRTQVERYWGIIRTSIPWMSNDVNQTLEDSPFSSHVELYNFLSSEDMKIRTVRKIGPPLYSSSFQSQLAQSITKTQVTGYVLAPRKDRPQTLGLDQYQQLLSRLSLAMGLPKVLQPERAVHYLLRDDKYKLYTTSQEIINLPRRVIKLAFVQAFSRSDLNRNDLDMFLRTARAGIITVFPVPQKRVTHDDKTFWGGPGEVHVSLERLVAYIKVLDKKIVRIHVNSIIELRRNFNTLMDHLRSMGFNSVEKSINSLGDVVFTGSSIVKSGTGCPVFEDSRVSMSMTEMRDYYIQVRPEAISLRAMSRGRDVNVVRVPVNLHEIPNDALEGSRRNATQAWSNYEKLEAGAALALINKTIFNSPEFCELKRWCSRTLRCRLTLRNYPSCDPSICGTLSTLDEMEDSDMDDEELHSYLIGISEVSSGVKDLIDNKVIALAEQTTSILDVDGGVPLEVLQTIVHACEEDLTHRDITPGLRKNRTSYYTHPFWDGFIDTVGSTGRNAWSDILMGRVPIGGEETARLLMRLLDIKESKARKSLDEKLAALSSGSAQSVNDEWDTE